MKVLGIMGSPRIEGNTDLLLKEALSGAQSRGAKVEKIIVNELNIHPCQECYGCLKEGSCIVSDDMDDIYPKLLGADIIIVASPMFFYGIPSQLKALIDRCQALWVKKHILKIEPLGSERKGAFIGVGATKGKKLFDGAVMVIKYFFEAVGVEYVDELLVRGVDQIGEVKDHPTALSDAFELGKRLVGSSIIKQQ